MVGYIQDAASREGGRHRVVDTRGRRWSWVGSSARLAEALATMALSRLSAPGLIHHLHVAGRGSTTRKLLLAFAARTMGCRHVLHLHDYDYATDVLRRPRWMQRRIAAMFRHADRVVVLGRKDRDFVETILGVPGSRIVTMPNSVPDPGARAPERRGEPPGILFLGRLSERKGVPELLAALAHPDMAGLAWRAVLAGDGPVEAYQAMAAEFGLDGRVAMPGWLGEAEVRALCAESDVLVLPSHAEGMAMAVIEGLAHGMGVVTTRVGAHEEVLADEVTGLFVPVSDVGALAGALSRLLRDEGLHARLSRNGRALFRERFAIEGYVERLGDLYGGLRVPGPGAAGPG